jgi:acetyltransferase-like isoleucine patch superfamily enzyme
MGANEFLSYLESGRRIGSGLAAHLFMPKAAQEALRITTKINSQYHSPEEIRALMSELTGKPVDKNFRMFPPFYTDFEKNINLGKKVFINSGRGFQD